MRRSKPKTSRPGGRGFTLIELLIAVVIIGVVATVALPSFLGAIRKSRRAEAIAALSAVQSAQERWRANNLSYAPQAQLTNGPLDTPPGLGVRSPTASGYYSISLSNTSNTGYIALATAVSGTSQANDGDCAQMQVHIDVGNILYGSGPAAGGITESAAGTSCWSR